MLERDTSKIEGGDNRAQPNASHNTPLGQHSVKSTPSTPPVAEMESSPLGSPSAVHRHTLPGVSPTMDACDQDTHSNTDANFPSPGGNRLESASEDHLDVTVTSALHVSEGSAADEELTPTLRNELPASPGAGVVSAREAAKGFTEHIRRKRQQQQQQQQQQQPLNAQWPLQSARSPQLSSLLHSANVTGAGFHGASQRRPLLTTYHVDASAPAGGMYLPFGYEATALSPTRAARYPYWNLQPRVAVPRSLSPSTANLGTPTTLGNAGSPQASLNVSLALAGANQSISLRDGATFPNASFVNAGGREASMIRESSFLPQSPYFASPVVVPGGMLSQTSGIRGPTPRPAFDGCYNTNNNNTSCISVSAAGLPYNSATRSMWEAPAQLSLSPPVDRAVPTVTVGDCILESSPLLLASLACDDDAAVAPGYPSSSAPMSHGPLPTEEEEELLEAEQLGSSQSNRTHGSTSQLHSAFYQPLRPPFRMEGSQPSPPVAPTPPSPQSHRASAPPCLMAGTVAGEAVVSHMGNLALPATNDTTPAETPTSTPTAGDHASRKTVTSQWARSRTGSASGAGGLEESGAYRNSNGNGAGTASDCGRSGDEVPRKLDHTARPERSHSGTAQDMVAAMRSAEASLMADPQLAAAAGFVATPGRQREGRPHHNREGESHENNSELHQQPDESKMATGVNRDEASRDTSDDEDDNSSTARTEHGQALVRHPSSPLSRGCGRGPSRRRARAAATSGVAEANASVEIETRSSSKKSRPLPSGGSPISLSVGSDSGLGALAVHSVSREGDNGLPFIKLLQDPSCSLQNANGTFLSCGPLTPAYTCNRAPVIQSLCERSVTTPSSTPTAHGPLQPGHASYGSIAELASAGGSGGGAGAAATVALATVVNSHNTRLVAADSDQVAKAAPIATVAPPAWRVGCPLEEMSDLIEVARLFSSDVHNLLHPIPPYLYSLQAATTRTLAQLFGIVDCLSETVGGNGETFRTVNGFLPSQWQPLLDRCNVLTADVLPAAAEEAIRIGQSARVVARRKLVIAAWTAEALQEAVEILDEAATVAVSRVREPRLRYPQPVSPPMLFHARIPTPLPQLQGLDSAGPRMATSEGTPTSPEVAAVMAATTGSSSSNGGTGGVQKSPPAVTASSVSRRVIVARAHEMGVDELCELLMGENALRDALGSQHPAAVAKAQTSQVRVALLRTLLAAGTHHSTSHGQPQQQQQKKEEVNAIDTQATSTINNEAVNRPTDTVNTSSFTQPASSLRGSSREAEKERLLSECTQLLVAQINSAYRHQSSSHSNGGNHKPDHLYGSAGNYDPVEQQNSDFCARSLPSYETTLQHFADMSNPTTWTWWYGWQLATHIAAGRRASSMERVELHASSFVQDHERGRELLLALRGDASAWCEDVLRTAERALSAEEAAYSALTRQCLQRMLRRIVLRACSEESHALLKAQEAGYPTALSRSTATGARTGEAISAPSLPTAATVLAACVSAHYESVCEAHKELCTLVDFADEDLRQLQAFLDKWRRQANTESAATAKGNHRGRPLSPTAAHRVAILQDGCENPSCTYCRGEGLYATAEDRLSVVQSALAAAETTVGQLLHVLRRGYTASSSASGTRAKSRCSNAGNSFYERATTVVGMAVADRTTLPSIPISLLLRQTASARTNAFEDDAMEENGGSGGEAKQGNSPRRPSSLGGKYPTSALNGSDRKDTHDGVAAVRANGTTPTQARQSVKLGKVTEERRTPRRPAASKELFIPKSSTRALNRLQRSLDDLSVSLERNLITLLQ